MERDGLALGFVSALGAGFVGMLWVRIRFSNHPDAAPDTSSGSELVRVRVGVLGLGSP